MTGFSAWADCISLAASQCSTPWISAYWDPLKDAVVVHCAKCDRIEQLTQSMTDTGNWMLAAESILERHGHSTDPLTPAEREAVRIRLVHRRGALRI